MNPHSRAAKQQSAVALAVCHGPGNAMTVDRILTVLVAVAAKILVWDLALIQVSLNFLFDELQPPSAEILPYPLLQGFVYP